MNLKWLLWAPISAVFASYRQHYALLLSVLGTSFQYGLYAACVGFTGVFLCLTLSTDEGLTYNRHPLKWVNEWLNGWMNEWILSSQMLEDLWTFLTKNNMVTKMCLQSTYFLMLFKMAIDVGILLLGTFLNKQIQRLIFFFFYGINGSSTFIVFIVWNRQLWWDEQEFGHFTWINEKMEIIKKVI